MSECPPQLPNAETALAWLPPDIAAQLQASSYLYVAVLGAWIWDFLMSSWQEFTMLTKYRFSFPQVAYIIARVSSLAYIVTATVFQVGNVGNCNALLIAIGTVGAIAVPANSFLMFLRVRAVFSDSKLMVATFGFLWVATLAGSMTAPFSLRGIHIGTTQRCINSEVKPYGDAGIVTSTCNDALVFLAITYRLIMHHVPTDKWSHRLRSFIRGDGMGRMSKLLLQTGQLYYLATAGMNILTSVSILAPAFPPVLHAMFTVPNVALTNAMACRVFRQLKLGLLVERPADSFSQRSDTLAFTPRTGTRRTGQSTTYLARDTFVSGSRDRTSLKVSVHQETEIASHEDPSSGSLKGEDLASDV